MARCAWRAEAMQFEHIAAVRCRVGESPVWCDRTQAWFWVDITARKVWRLESGTGAVRSWDSPEMAASIAPMESGGLIAGMETGVFALALGDCAALGATRLAMVRHDGAPMRFNDGRCDRQGRFWSGTMYLDMAEARPLGHLYRFTLQDGLSAPVVSDLIVQNGLAWSPDGRTMYLSDSHPARRLIWAYDYDQERGIPSQRRLFVDMHAHAPGRPDGAAMDVDGCYWICANDGGAVMRFTPQGKLDRTIRLPMAKPSMCAFGGPGLDTLLVTSIDAGLQEDGDWGGAVVTLRPGVQGMAETRFAG
jgi:sugar lactone lactonase YvrE